MTDYARLKALILAWYDGQVPPENGDIKFGENVHWFKSQEGANASDVIEDWYFNEEPKWNYQEPRVTPETQEFSQMTWNSTAHFGCGQAVSEGTKGGTYTVCYYDPPGNVVGQEKQNVFEPSYNNVGGETSGGGTGTSAPSPGLLRAFISAQRGITPSLKFQL